MKPRERSLNLKVLSSAQAPLNWESMWEPRRGSLHRPPLCSVSSFLQRMGRSGRGEGNLPTSPASEGCLRTPLYGCCDQISKQKGSGAVISSPKNRIMCSSSRSCWRSSGKGRSSRSHIRRFVKGLFAFREIKPREIDSLLGFLDDSGILVGDGDMLMPGPGARRHSEDPTGRGSSRS